MNSSTPSSVVIFARRSRNREFAATPPPTPSRFIPVRQERLAGLGDDDIDDRFLKARGQVAELVFADGCRSSLSVLAVERIQDRRLQAREAQEQPLVVQK